MWVGGKGIQHTRIFGDGTISFCGQINHIYATKEIPTWNPSVLMYVIRPTATPSESSTPS